MTSKLIYPHDFTFLLNNNDNNNLFSTYSVPFSVGLLNAVTDICILSGLMLSSTSLITMVVALRSISTVGYMITSIQYDRPYAKSQSILLGLANVLTIIELTTLSPSHAYVKAALVIAGLQLILAYKPITNYLRSFNCLNRYLSNTSEKEYNDARHFFLVSWSMKQFTSTM